MEEELEGLLDKMNKFSWAGGNTSILWKKLGQRIQELEYEKSFCLLSRNRVMGIVSSLNEITDSFFGESTARELRTERFLNCKGDILKTLAKGVISQTVNGD